MADHIEPLTDDQFKELQDFLRKQKEEAEKNRPDPQGDYQWDGGWSFNGGFGQYQALRHKGKRIGGMFLEGSSFPGEYHAFDETGGVYSEASQPPVPHLKPKNQQE